MKREFISEEKKELDQVCKNVKELVGDKKYEVCEVLLQTVIGKYPHAPQPHNLYGILLEKEGNHEVAMKHFRAAWVLDPTYLPARENMDCYGSFTAKKVPVFEEEGSLELSAKEKEAGALATLIKHKPRLFTAS